MQDVRKKHQLILFLQMTFLLHVVFRNHLRPKNAEFSSNQVLSGSNVNDKVNISSHTHLYFKHILVQDFDREETAVSCTFLQMIQRPHSNSGPPCLEDLVAKEENAIDIAVKPTSDQFISEIISSTPELRQFHGCMDVR